MKRYDMPGNYLMEARIDGLWLSRSEVQSHARALLAVVERMEHGVECKFPFGECAHIKADGWRCRLCDDGHEGLDHAYVGAACDCGLGELRRGLEVMAGLKEMAK